MINEENNDLKKEDDKPHFLPMSFNLVLDYFNKKGKVRGSEKTINLAIVTK
jgi:hypothetical protein